MPMEHSNGYVVYIYITLRAICDGRAIGKGGAWPFERAQDILTEKRAGPNSLLEPYANGNLEEASSVRFPLILRN